MYRLYWRERTGAFAPAAVLEELGLPWEGVHVAAEGQQSAAFRAQNPMAQVPLLILPDGGKMTESAAIALYLAETRPESGLAPAPAEPIRPQFLRWLFFAQANLYETDLRYTYPARYTAEPAGAPGVERAARARFDRLWDLVAEAIGGPFLFGARFTLLDIYLAMLAAWPADPPALVARRPELARLVAATVARPAIARTWRRFDMDARLL